jgi:hypothetical protein
VIRRRDERGQTLVELALILPIFLMLLVGIFDLGHVVWTNDLVSNAAREGARYSIVHGGSATTDCPVGPDSGEAIIPTPSADCPFPSPLKDGIYETARDWTNMGGGAVTVTACYWHTTPCSGDTDEVGATNARGMRVTVTVTADVHLIAPGLIGFDQVSLSSSSTMLVNH